MLAWIMILTVVGYNGQSSHISARYATAKQCYAAGERVSLSVADRVGSTAFICRKGK